jgi:anti-sigma factor RsiW
LLGIERWGTALVLTVRNSPFGASGDALLASVLEALIQRAFARDAGVVRLVRDDALARFLVTSRASAELVRVWLSSGSTWSDALARLQPQAGGGAS